MMHYKKAKLIADRIVELITPFCDLVHIAGSIRREKEFVKDIEIVCLPKKEFVSTDLFGGGHNKRVAGFHAAIDIIQDKIVKGNTEGRLMQIICKGGAVMDLFMPQKEDYYRQLAIRTGSADFSNFVIAHAWKKKGWCGTHDGLRLQLDCTLNEKTKNWNCWSKSPTLPPEWQSEEEFFTWLGLNWLHPKDREIKSSVKVYQ
jgi:DNA polymerase/3'-5' exonuclease PolX